MAQRSPNPLILSPASRFAAKDYTSALRSPSRSPTRRQEFTAQEIDPLLSNLSPISTLEALQATDAVVLAPGSRQRVLSESISDASTSERALAIRAALAGKKLREWYTEVDAWQWPTTGFEEPAVEEKWKNGRDVSYHGRPDQVLANGKSAASAALADDDSYPDPFPVHVIQDYEARIEMIRDDMETLDVEELKEHVRGAHHLSRSRPSSIYDVGPTNSPSTRYSHLDDFTVVITATIMQALPFISRLNNLLDVWFVRLVVLRQVPGFLQQLDDARTAVDSAWNVIGSSRDSSTVINSNISRRTYLTMKSVLQDRVAELGQRLDAMLDALEGGLDRLPDHWIDNMERVQEDYETWVVDAERLVDENDWRLQQEAASFLASMQPQATDKLSNGALSREKQQTSIIHTQNNQLPASNDITHPTNESSIIDETQRFDLLGHHISNDQAHPVDGTRSDLLFRNKFNESSLVTHDGASCSDEPVLGDLVAVIQRPSRRPSDGALTPSTGRKSPPRRPPPLELQQPAAGTDSTVSSDLSEPGSAASNYSDMSSPEILDAARVEYFKSPTEDKVLVFPPKDFTSPHDTMSRHSSQRTERSTTTVREPTTIPEDASSVPRSRASSFVPEPTIFEHGSKSNIENTEGHIRPDLGLKRASATSIEVLSRSELRNIIVRRSGSHSSNSSAVSRRKSDSATQEPPLHFSILRGHIEHDGPSPSHSRSGTPLLEHETSPSIRASKRRHSFFNTLSDFTFTSSPPSRSGTPLQTMAEIEAASNSPPKAKKEDKCSTAPANPPILQSPPKRLPSPRTTTLSPSQSIEEQLTARITSILTHIPADIRLTTGEEASTLTTPPAPASAESTTPSTLPLPPLSPVATPSLTLAPAPKPPSHSQSDSEIKLYHLHQPGAALPIKLYVRLVGEARERVMVRVGGGWADLGAYLHDYASHHGRRAVSDGRFELMGLPTSSPASTPATRDSSRDTPPSHPPSPPPRSMRRLRLSSGAAAVTPDSASAGLPSGAATPTRGRRVSGAADDDTPPLGLAGPKSRNVLISPGRKAWVDSMLDQARKVSGSGSGSGEKGEKGDVGVGKVGATRRVFLRGRTEEYGGG